MVIKPKFSHWLTAYLLTSRVLLSQALCMIGSLEI